jgi:hypothetical protein
MSVRVPHTGPTWLAPRRIVTCAAGIASAALVARELVLLEPGIFPVHHALALVLSLVAPVAAGPVLFRLRRFAALAAFALGYVLPLLALAALNVFQYARMSVALDVLGLPRLHLVALPFALTGAWLFGAGRANAEREDGSDRVAICAGAWLVTVGVATGERLLSYSGRAAVPTGGWVLAGCSATAIGAGLGALMVSLARRRALAAFLRRAVLEENGEWRVRPELASELERPLAALGPLVANQGVLEKRVATGTDPYRTTEQYTPIARVPLACPPWR